jgi:hypothetical protein
MFSLLNNRKRVGNYSSRECNFLSFSATAGSESSRDFLDALYVIDRRAVTKLAKMTIGLRIAHLYWRPNAVRLHIQKD